MRPVLFLDVDGVLNGHDYDPVARSNTIRRECVEQLNRVIAETDCLLVISSAWRYMVLNGAMKPVGFEYLLKTHGVHAHDRVFDFLPEDGQSQDEADRVLGVRRWVRTFAPDCWAVVDDLDLVFLEGEAVFVRTDGTAGLSSGDADRLIEIMRRSR